MSSAPMKTKFGRSPAAAASAGVANPSTRQTAARETRVTMGAPESFETPGILGRIHLYSASHADATPRPLPRPGRRLHVLRPGAGPAADRHARLPLRARPAGHPDPQP